MVLRRFCRMFSLKLSILFFSYCVIVSMYFSEGFVVAFSIVFFVGVLRPRVKWGMLFLFGVSESFKGVWGVTEVSDVESLFKLTKDKCYLTLSWRRPLSYRNQSIDLRSKSIDWFLYDKGLRHESVKTWVVSYSVLVLP